MAGLVNLKELWKDSRRRMAKGVVVAVLAGKLEDRGLELIRPVSRVVPRGEIHELILTDNEEASPGKKIGRIAYICFFEIIQAGILLVGDKISVGGRVIGEIAGFDETHMPNHLNIVVKGKKLHSGLDLHLQLGATLAIKEKRKKQKENG